MKKIKLYHIIILLNILLVLYVIVGRIVTVKERKDLFQNGQMTICKVYDIYCDGEVDICDGDYFFFYEGKKYFDFYIINPYKINPEGRYYKVFFLPKNPDRSVVDYSIEINVDSVYKYFPPNQNPFEAEIKQDK